MILEVRFQTKPFSYFTNYFFSYLIHIKITMAFCTALLLGFRVNCSFNSIKRQRLKVANPDKHTVCQLP